MKTVRCVILSGCIVSILLFVFHSESMAQNLIMNPGCEDSLIHGDIPYWIEMVGSNWTQRMQNPEPQEGEKYFFPGVAATAELRQDVNVSMYADNIDHDSQTFEFSGYVRSYPQSPADYSQIVLEYLDASKSSVLYTFESEQSAVTSEWVLVTDRTEAPPGTRYIRVRLISTRRNGSNNDGYYDNLSLSLYEPVSVDDADAGPQTVILTGNYPNPFNPVTTIAFTLGFDDPRPVTLAVYDCRGTLIRRLVSGIFSPGMHAVQWDGRNETGNRVSSGVYLYRIQSGQCVASQKMLLIR